MNEKISTLCGFIYEKEFGVFLGHSLVPLVKDSIFGVEKANVPVFCRTFEIKTYQVSL